jgi:transcription elongation factor Elf1
VSHISRTAKFSSSDSLPDILADLACPSCGHRDVGEAFNRITDNKIRIFCDSCGAFATIELNDDQTLTCRRWSGTMSAISDGTPPPTD